MSENTMNNLKIGGVDVGGTKIEAVLVDAIGHGIGSARIPAIAWQRCVIRRHNVAVAQSGGG